MDIQDKKIHFPYDVQIILGGLMLFVTLLSIFVFSKQSLRLDEAQSLWQTSRSPLKILNIIAQDVHVPLYHLMLHYWQIFFGNAVATVRFFSLIFFVLSIPAIYLLGKITLGKKQGLFAATIFAISPFMNWYGNETRMYSLFTFAVILSNYFFIKLASDQNIENKVGNWITYLIVNMFGIYTHYFFLLALASQGVYLLFNKKRFHTDAIKRFFIVSSVLVIELIPWVWYVRKLNTISNSSPLLLPPTSVNVFNTFSNFLFGFQIDSINTILVSLWPLSIVLAFLALRKNNKISHHVIFFVITFIMPILVAFIFSVTIRPVYLSRYLILTLPSLYLLLSWISSTYPKYVERTFKIILVGIMLTTLFIQAVSVNTPVKENYHSASMYLEQMASSSDIIVISAPFTIYPMLYYYNGPAQLTTLPKWDRTGSVPSFDLRTLPAQIDTLKKNHTNLWLLLSYNQGYEMPLRLYFDTHFERLQAKTFSPGLTLYEYRLRY